MRDAGHSSSCAVAALGAALATLTLSACTTDGLERLGAGRASSDAGADRQLDDPLRTDTSVPSPPEQPPDHSVQPGGTEPPPPPPSTGPGSVVPSDAGTTPSDPDAGPIEPGPELFPNPSFEAGHAGWVGFGTSGIMDVLQPHTGSRAILSTNRNYTWEGPIYDIHPLVAPGQPHAVSAWVRNEVGTHNIMITLKATCGSETSYTPLSTRAVATQWQQLDASFIVPDCSDLAELAVYIEGPPANSNILVDDVSLRAITLGAANNIATSSSSGNANANNASSNASK